MKKKKLKLNRPSYVGICILDLSKTLTYDYNYNYIKDKYGKKAKLLFTDNGSLTYHIETDDAYSDFYKDRDLFDNSDYSKTFKFHFVENKKVIGKFKDEAAGSPITEFVGLRSKMYSWKIEDGTNKKTAKGVEKNVIKRDVDHDNYLL